jgi:glycolate oxidase
VVGDRYVLSAPFEKALYGRDASALDPSTPGVVVLPRTTAEVVAVMNIARQFDRPVTPRGSGTGLAGGALPVAEPIVVVTARMNDIVSIDAEQRTAWAQPGVLNLDLTRDVHRCGHLLHYAPDPSSQQSCSIGGNVATNAGGPHCLLHGVTSAHILAVEVVLPDGSTVVLGDAAPDSPGYDLRGIFVGSEGTMGVCTKALVRLMADPPAVRTFLADFNSIREASQAVSDVIASGVLPAALEMMDANCIAAVERFSNAGLPLDAAAVLLVEIEGLSEGVDAETVAIIECLTHAGARHVRTAADATERALLWKARKSAFGAIANIKPNYELHDTVVPRTRLAEVMDEVTAIAQRHGLIVLNVFHAGDGNLHPLLVFDRREPGMAERVHEAGREIIEASLRAGGVLSGEHGIGLEKRDYMGLLFSPADLDHQSVARTVFDPDRRCNPTKVLPGGSRCREIGGAIAATEEMWV